MFSLPEKYLFPEVEALQLAQWDKEKVMWRTGGLKEVNFDLCEWLHVITIIIIIISEQKCIISNVPVCAISNNDSKSIVSLNGCGLIQLGHIYQSSISIMGTPPTWN